MCAYNRINDTYACENDQTLNKDLKTKMKFQVCHVPFMLNVPSLVIYFFLSVIAHPHCLISLSLSFCFVQGFVMSDWGATHSTVKAANGGLDMQMPDASFFGTPLLQAVQSGQVSMDRLNGM